MKDVILIALANRWILSAKTPQQQDGSETSKEENAFKKGQRETRRECADTLKILVEMLGDE